MIDVDYAELDRQIAEMDNPEPGIVPMPLTAVLIEQMQPLREILIRYAYLVNATKEIHPIDTELLRKQYGDRLRLLNHSVGVLSSCTAICLTHALAEIDKAIANKSLGYESEIAETLTRHLFANIQLTETIPSLKDLDFEGDKPSAEDQAHYERLLSDEALLNAEFEYYSAQIKRKGDEKE